VLPKRDVFKIRSTEVPGQPTGAIFISGSRDGASADGYYLARLKQNLVAAATTSAQVVSGWRYRIEVEAIASQRAVEKAVVGERQIQRAAITTVAIGCLHQIADKAAVADYRQDVALDRTAARLRRTGADASRPIVGEARRFDQQQAAGSGPPSDGSSAKGARINSAAAVKGGSTNDQRSARILVTP